MNIKAIEGNFPFEHISEIAEVESWRKEVYRPIYHMHKWWAKRLGSIFRAIILGATYPEGSDIMNLMYSPVKLEDITIFDPFMGSGTTIGEAHKLGCNVIGRDINPIAYRLTKTALSKLSRQKLIEQFDLLRTTVKQDLQALYKSIDEHGNDCDVLYYFWVKILPCPSCKVSVDLFSTYVFAKHAYPKKHPQVHIVCPTCKHIFAGIYNKKVAICPQCNLNFNPSEGPVKRAKATCSNCGEVFAIAKTAFAQGHPPQHCLYAKLILDQNDNKKYLPITTFDLDLYKQVQQRFYKCKPPLPHIKIKTGHNTQQILNYGYQYWDDMFNERQLLALSILLKGIKHLDACPERDVLMLLFSGVLEFNNMFASYKGEGTGAVRHIFSHHILKPERMPIEANLWGTPKSSGAFSTLFRSKMLRAIDYKDNPFEVAVKRQGNKKGEKIFGISPPIGAVVVDNYIAMDLNPKSLYLSCDSSTKTDIPNESVDLIITDPPFFDNVHYAELADFFYGWQQLYFDESFYHTKSLKRQTTRHPQEVQDSNVKTFTKKLTNVFHECHRVLHSNGMMVFSYHHSREEGWSAIAEAILSSKFSFVQAQPVKAEMSVATPKSQANNPIDLDIILVCRKQECDNRPYLDSNTALRKAYKVASIKCERFNKLGRLLSKNDIKVILYSQLLVALSPKRCCKQFSNDFDKIILNRDDDIKRLYHNQENLLPDTHQTKTLQLSLF